MLGGGRLGSREEWAVGPHGGRAVGVLGVTRALVRAGLHSEEPDGRVVLDRSLRHLLVGVCRADNRIAHIRLQPRGRVNAGGGELGRPREEGDRQQHTTLPLYTGRFTCPPQRMTEPIITSDARAASTPPEDTATSNFLADGVRGPNRAVNMKRSVPAAAVHRGCSVSTGSACTGVNGSIRVGGGAQR